MVAFSHASTSLDDNFNITKTSIVWSVTICSSADYATCEDSLASLKHDKESF
jgi:hypothetical protein